jgi:hypothetical protein
MSHARLAYDADMLSAFIFSIILFAAAFDTPAADYAAATLMPPTRYFD